VSLTSTGFAIPSPVKRISRNLRYCRLEVGGLTLVPLPVY
jgi:hypothetical protein